MKSKFKSGFSLIELSVVILVIGILVIGITKGSRIMSEAKLKSARSITNSSPVASISNLAMWVETTSENSLINSQRVNGGTISDWYNINPQDKLSANNNVAQSNIAKRPTYVVNGIGGLPVIRFDGVDDYLASVLATNTNVSLPTENRDRTLFVVYGKASVASGSTWNFIFHYGTESSTNRVFDFGACQDTMSGKPATVHMWNTEYVTSPSKNTCDGNNYITSVTYKALNNTSVANNIEVHINGVAYSDNVAVARTNNIAGSTAAITLSTSSSNLTIGSRDSGADQFKGDIGEIIMYNKRLSSNERISVENYLKQKWGIKY